MNRLIDKFINVGRRISKQAEKYEAVRPALDLGKRYIYNPYLKSKLVSSDFPPEIWIENTNICNAKCPICPREKQTRELGYMHYDLYEKLIEEISHYKDKVRRVHLHNYGEPLLDRDLAMKIKFAKESGITHTYIVTNASLLDPEKSREIIEAGLDELKISFYGTDSETYNKTMVGLDYEKTLRNIKEFIRLRSELRKDNPKLILQYIPTDTNESRISDFIEIMKPLINESVGDEVNIWHLHNYGDGRSFIRLGRIKYTCEYPWRTMVIMQNGNVVLCCHDYNGIQVIGDVNKNTIHEIWNSPEYENARRNFKSLRYEDFPICLKCNVIH